MNDDKLWAEPCRDVGILQTFISSYSGDGEQRRVLCVGEEVVSVFVFDSTLRLFHGLPVYGFTETVFG